MVRAAVFCCQLNSQEELLVIQPSRRMEVWSSVCEEKDLPVKALLVEPTGNVPLQNRMPCIAVWLQPESSSGVYRRLGHFWLT